MELKTILKRYPVFILGLYFLSLGIVLIVRSALGTTPISSINYVLSINSALSLGTWTFLFNLLLIAGQFWLIRDRYSRRDILEILLQIPFSFLFAAFIDFNMMFTGQLHPGSYGLSVALLLTGCVVQSIGVVLEIKPRVAMMSAEAFVKYASQRYNREFGKFKVCFDITLVTLGRSPLLPPQPTHRGHTRRIAHRRLHHRLHRHFPQPPDHHPQNTLQSAAHPSKKDLPERMMLPPPSERLHFKRPSVSVYSDQ